MTSIGSPPRARTAYVIFAGQNRQKMQTQNPDLSPGEISKMLAEMWQDMGEKARAPYEKESEEEKAALWRWRAEQEADDGPVFGGR